jgi:hypothetical protein
LWELRNLLARVADQLAASRVAGGSSGSGGSGCSGSSGSSGGHHDIDLALGGTPVAVDKIAVVAFLIWNTRDAPITVAVTTGVVCAIVTITINFPRIRNIR